MKRNQQNSSITKALAKRPASLTIGQKQTSAHVAQVLNHIQEDVMNDLNP